MPTEDAYSASPENLRRGTSMIAELGDYAKSLVREFYDDAASTAGWTGRDDSMAKELIPIEEKERTSTTRTADSLRDGVVGVANGVHVNMTNITTTQNNNIDAITSSSHGGKRR